MLKRFDILYWLDIRPLATNHNFGPLYFKLCHYEIKAFSHFNSYLKKSKNCCILFIRCNEFFWIYFYIRVTLATNCVAQDKPSGGLTHVIPEENLKSHMHYSDLCGALELKVSCFILQVVFECMMWIESKWSKCRWFFCIVRWGELESQNVFYMNRVFRLFLGLDYCMVWIGL